MAVTSYSGPIVGFDYPLRSPLSELDVADAPAPPSICTLLVSEAGDEWLAQHVADVDEAAAVFCRTVGGWPEPIEHQWVSTHFDIAGGFTLATRGGLGVHGILHVALLEVD